VWGCKIPMFLPVLKRDSQRRDPTFVTRREGPFFPFPGFTKKFLVRIVHTGYTSSFEPVTQDLSCVAAHRRHRVKLLPSFYPSVLWRAWLACPPPPEPAKPSLINQGCQAA
jgi:hypothetical protein